MKNEKPGGHGERSVAVGVLDMALWDALAKAHGAALWRLLADRYSEGQADATAWVYAAGGYYYPGKGLSELQDEMRSYLDRGYSTVKMKVGLAPLADDLARIEAALTVVGGDGSKRRSGRGDPLRPRRRALRAALVRRAARSPRLPRARRARDPLRAPAGDGREPVLAPGRPQSHPPRG